MGDLGPRTLQRGALVSYHSTCLECLRPQQRMGSNSERGPSLPKTSRIRAMAESATWRRIRDAAGAASVVPTGLNHVLRPPR